MKTLRARRRPRATWLAFSLTLLGCNQPGQLVSAQEPRFLGDLQRRTFNFFWETTPVETGLTPDRWPSRSESSIAAVGFGLTAYGVGVENGWVTREAAAERTLSTLRFFRQSEQGEDPVESAGHRGFYYHFLEIDSGRRWRKCELSSIDTALLMMGVLFAQEYFDGDNAIEREIRRTADALYRRVEWDWFQPRPPLLAMGWQPEPGQHTPDGFGRADYRGYNEAMFLYLLALGSPTHAIDPAGWEAFCGEYDGDEFHGEEFVQFAPLFGHQYTACWIDLRGIQDASMRGRGIDYFENSRRATLSQRAYAIANPGGWRGYGEDIWGLTACDGPGIGRSEYQGEPRRFAGYWARGAGANEIRDDGTIAPTAAGGSIPFAPEETLRALAAMKEQYGEHLYGEYGFFDSFNPSCTDPSREYRHGAVHEGIGWVNADYLGIDQGPILLQSENHRSAFVWQVMRNSAYLREGLRRAGFTGGWLEEDQTKDDENDNPAED